MRDTGLWIQIGAVLGSIGIALGAFGAHALKARLEPAQLASWNTAVEYHLLHCAVLLGVALFGAASGRSVALPASLFAAGVVLFSGSIYLLVLTGQRWLGPVTPIGGLCFIAGWLTLIPLGRSLASS